MKLQVDGIRDMCGIVGYMGKFEVEQLEMASQTMFHRGPDDFGIWVDRGQGIGMGHRRLSIIDLTPHGHQPMCNSDETIVIVFNGEIYNYRELRKEILPTGYHFRSTSDTEVLIALYEMYGVEMLGKLNGIFAFAIWDSNKKEILLAKDGLGVKPLYYSECRSGFVFASEIKALLCFNEIDRTINPYAIQYNLAYLWTPAPHTMLKHVKKMEPGFFMTVKGGHIINHQRFYDLPYNGDYLNADEDDIVSILEEKLFDAVNRQLVADVPVGAFLSGGLDSSSVVAMMKKARPDHRPTCYCIGFEGDLTSQETADIPYARQVAEHLDVDLKLLVMHEEDLIANLEKMIFFLDEPEADPAPIYVMMIAQQAKKDGYKVLLSGTGGDDVFSGYRRHMAVLFERYWAGLPLAVRNMLQKISEIGSVRNPLFRRMKRVFAYASLSPEERLYTYWYWANDKLRSGLYHRDFKKLLNGHETWRPLQNSLKAIPEEKNRLNQMLYLEAKHFLADHNLNYTDKAAMAYGVEVRVPLVDSELIDFVCKIPPDLKHTKTVGKSIFKKTMEKYLPKKAIYRSKTGFGASMRGWHKNSIKNIMEDTLSKQSITRRGFFDYDGVQDMIRRDSANLIDGSYTIFSMICMEIWCRQFIDKKYPSC